MSKLGFSRLFIFFFPNYFISNQLIFLNTSIIWKYQLKQNLAIFIVLIYPNQGIELGHPSHGKEQDSARFNCRGFINSAEEYSTTRVVFFTCIFLTRIV